MNPAQIIPAASPPPVISIRLNGNPPNGLNRRIICAAKGAKGVVRNRSQKQNHSRPRCFCWRQRDGVEAGVSSGGRLASDEFTSGLCAVASARRAVVFG